MARNLTRVCFEGKRCQYHSYQSPLKVSLIGTYKYPLVEKLIAIDRIRLAGILDIGLMKILAITHRATLRDYIDLAAIIRDHIPLPRLLEASKQKYGPNFNILVLYVLWCHLRILNQKCQLYLTLRSLTSGKIFFRRR
jgi:hypothetical protein